MKIDYVEFPATDFELVKSFYSAAFGWEFVDWGPDYVAFSNAGLEGGFRRVDKSAAKAGSTGALVILLAEDLEAAEKSVTNAGGKILERHAFPGGRRFHFADPCGNELAVWMKVDES